MIMMETEKIKCDKIHLTFDCEVCGISNQEVNGIAFLGLTIWGCGACGELYKTGYSETFMLECLQYEF